MDNLPFYEAEPGVANLAALGSHLFDGRRCCARIRRIRRRRCRGRAAAAVGHCRAYFHLVLYTAGTNALLLDDRVVPVERGSLVLIDPERRYRFTPLSPRAVRMTVLAWELLEDDGRPVTPSWQTVLRRWTDPAAVVPTDPLTLTPAGCQRLDARLGNLLVAARGHAAAAPGSVAAGFLSVLAELTAALDQDERTDPGLDRALAVITDDLTAEIRIDDLARRAGCSRRWFLERFKRRYGTTPLAMQQRLRLDRAKALLADDRRSVAAVAAAVGYPDPAYFSRLFSRTFGRSPRRWRQESAENEW